MKYVKIVGLLLALSITGLSAKKTEELATETARFGYTLGTQIAADMAQSGLQKELDVPAMLKGMQDVFDKKALKLTPEQMQATQKLFQEKQQKAFAELVAKNKAKGEEFLIKNKENTAVKSTESGLQYEELRSGEGAIPTTKDTVNVHYEGRLINGTVFDSSYQRKQPADFPVTGVVPGMTEALQLMKVGSKYRFTMPASLAYGEQGQGPIGPNEVLIFDVELLKIK